ncbi:hypothetical protein, partial [Kaistella sp.]|uniref:hypothetical protein n=1 Tax=Kaistella sp. TaxID=2782235 RepID=UPI002F95A6AE
MLRNIVILDNEPYSEVRKRNFFVDQFESAGYKVYHYTLVNYLTNSAAVNYIHKLDSPNAFCLDNKKQIKNMLKNINRNDTFLFLELPFNKNTLFIFNDLHKIKAKWGRLSYYTNPAVNLYKRQNVLTAARVKRYRNFQYVKFALFVKLFGRKIKSITESHITFKTGRSNFNFPKSRKLVNIDYFDLEEFKEKKYDAPVLNEEYIVFNDIFLPYHPDLQRINQGA